MNTSSLFPERFQRKLYSKLRRSRDAKNVKDRFKGERVPGADTYTVPIASANSCSNIQDRHNFMTIRSFAHRYCDDGPHNETSIGDSTEKTNVDAEYVKHLLNKSRQLKRHVRHFEDQYHFQRHPNEIKQIYHSLVQNVNRKRILRSEDAAIIAHHRSLEEQGKRIRRRSKRDNVVVYSVTPEIKSHSKHNSNSFVKPKDSRKKDFTKYDSYPDSSYFRTVAEEFIEQAEELKAKIAYILEYCGYVTSSSSNCSLDAPGSDSLPDMKNEPVNEFQHFNHLFITVNDQYSEIIRMLSSIEEHIIHLDKNKTKEKKSSVSQLKENHNQTGSSSFTKGHNGKDTNSLKHLKSKNKQPMSRRNDKKLEPVVLVYEPILPGNRSQSIQEVCKTCGHKFNSCTDVCDSAKLLPKSSSVLKGTKKDYKQKQKIGFVVMYTPDLNQNILPNDCLDVKDKKKMKKKTSCFWF